MQIAWGYLLPVGVCGGLNVGVKEEWIQRDSGVDNKDKDKSKGGDTVNNRSRQRSGSGVSGHGVHDPSIDGADTEPDTETGRGERRLVRSKASQDRADRKARRVRRSRLSDTINGKKDGDREEEDTDKSNIAEGGLGHSDGNENSDTDDRNDDDDNSEGAFIMIRQEQ